MKLEFIDVTSSRRGRGTPEVLDFGTNVVRYYPANNSLCVHRPDFRNPETGEMQPGKGVAFALDSLAGAPEAAARLLDILRKYTTLPL